MLGVKFACTSNGSEIIEFDWLSVENPGAAIPKETR
jgi:hypothetical protein